MAEDTAPADASFQEMDDFMNAAVDALDSGETDTSGSDISEADIAAVVEAETDSEVEDVVAVAADDDTPTTENAEPADEAENADEPGADQATVAPQSMSAKDREAFAALPPESQKWISDRAKEQEAAFTQKTMDLADKSKGFDKLEQILAPRRQQLAIDGMDDSTAVGQLFALSDYANNDPIGFVKYMLNARQIPVSALSDPGGQSPADPQLAAMQQKMQGFESFLTQQQTQARHQAESVINTDVESFAKAHEFYAELEGEMIPVVAALRQHDPNLSNTDALTKAYKMAIAANDGVSAKVEAARSVKADVDNVAMAKARAAKAKKAAGSNTRNSGARPAGKAGAASVDDFIGDLVDERMTA
tara:strand:- start:96 stop:1178 length:1083 start_codon:yes stop_codon:yes gene_type:complete